MLDNTVFALRKVENAVKPEAEEEDLLGEGEVNELESWFAEGDDLLDELQVKSKIHWAGWLINVNRVGHLKWELGW